MGFTDKEIKMNHTLELILLVVAAVCFAAAVIGVTSRVNLIALGLFCWILTVLIPQLK